MNFRIIPYQIVNEIFQYHIFNITHDNIKYLSYTFKRDRFKKRWYIPYVKFYYGIQYINKNLIKLKGI